HGIARLPPVPPTHAHVCGPGSRCPLILVISGCRNSASATVQTAGNRLLLADSRQPFWSIDSARGNARLARPNVTSARTPLSRSDSYVNLTPLSLVPLAFGRTITPTFGNAGAGIRGLAMRPAA